MASMKYGAVSKYLSKIVKIEAESINHVIKSSKRDSIMIDIKLFMIQSLIGLESYNHEVIDITDANE